MTDMVAHPPHYNNHPSGIEVIEYRRLLPTGPGDAVKYVMRRDLKGNPVQDLDKALWYLNDSIDHRISYALTATMHRKIWPVIDAEPHATVKSFLGALYLQQKGNWLFGNYPDLELARDLVLSLREEYL